MEQDKVSKLSDVDNNVWNEDGDNSKKMEQEKFFKGSGARVKPGDKDNPQSFKVRKAKVGGYRDYFTDEQCAQLDVMVAELDPIFGYGGEQV